MIQPAAARNTVIKKVITDNLTRIKNEIAQAAVTAGREPERIRVLAVTKSMPLEAIRVLLELGQIDLGESQAQQLVQRAGMVQEQLSRRSIHDTSQGLAKPLWHMIGHLQRNKVKPLLPIVQYIHSMDTLRLAEEINSFGSKINKVQDVLVEVNCSGEEQKYGLPVAAVGHLIEQISTMPNMRICGLMTMAPQVSDAEKTRPVFERLYELFLEVKVDYRLGKEFEHLSMGMSQDYQVAVECGATIVRIGSALFEGIDKISE
ncbi:MAG: YggS family pyridoxal phosphate-dependent enzyme [Phycisphaerae bacterium]